MTKSWWKCFEWSTTGNCNTSSGGIWCDPTSSPGGCPPSSGVSALSTTSTGGAPVTPVIILRRSSFVVTPAELIRLNLKLNGVFSHRKMSDVLVWIIMMSSRVSIPLYSHYIYVFHFSSLFVHIHCDPCSASFPAAVMILFLSCPIIPGIRRVLHSDCPTHPLQPTSTGRYHTLQLLCLQSSTSSWYTTKPLSILLTKLLTHIKQGLQKYCETAYSRSGINQMWLLKNSKEFIKRKRKRSDSVLWQKPLHQQKCQKGKVTTQTTPQKSSIKQRLRTDLGRSVGVTKATQLVWLTGLRAHLHTNRNSRLIKRTHV